MPRTYVLGPVRSRVSRSEWQARLDCAGLYRLMAHWLAMLRLPTRCDPGWWR